MNWSNWTVIDLWPQGKPGVETRYRWVLYKEGKKKLVLFIKGTDSAFDWILHFLPGWGAFAEEIYAMGLYKGIKDLLEDLSLSAVEIHGHSWGGAIASALQEILQAIHPRLECRSYGYGSKDPAFGKLGILYRHKGDWVPFLTPWRGAKWSRQELFGSFQPLWKAHQWQNYELKFLENSTKEE